MTEFIPSWGVFVTFRADRLTYGHFTIKLEFDNLNVRNSNIPQIMSQSLLLYVIKEGCKLYKGFILTGFQFIWVDIELSKNLNDTNN